MNKQFHTSSRLFRSMAGVAAFVACIATLGAVVGLAQHYNSEGMELAARATVLVADR